jgi:trehalose utilization protein
MKSLLAALSVLILSISAAEPIRVLVWDEQQPQQKQAYGEKFLGETIAAYLEKQPGLAVKSVSISSPEQGLDKQTLDNTDVIVWWGHVRHNDVADDRAEEVVRRVIGHRLALVALHSAHWSKPFVRLMQERAKEDALKEIAKQGQARPELKLVNEKPIGKAVKRDAPLTPSLRKIDDGGWELTLPACVFPAWRGDGAPGHMTTLLPKHPIAAGLPLKWDVNQTEMYDEPFHVPKPDLVVFEERWDKAEYFRSGCVWEVGKGGVFYLRPGHETFPVYKQAEPLRVVENAVRWLGKER